LRRKGNIFSLGVKTPKGGGKEQHYCGNFLGRKVHCGGELKLVEGRIIFSGTRRGRESGAGGGGILLPDFKTAGEEKMADSKRGEEKRTHGSSTHSGKKKKRGKIYKEISGAVSRVLGEKKKKLCLSEREKMKIYSYHVKEKKKKEA